MRRSELMRDVGLQLSTRRILTDGAVLSAAFMVIVVASIWLDARLWIDDYPPDIRAAVGDVAAPTAARVVFAVVLLGTILGGFIYSNRLFQRDLGRPLPFRAAFVHTFLLFWILNAFDVVIVDWLFFVTIQPSFVVLPGTEGLAGYKDYFFHFRVSFLNWAVWVGSIVGCAVVALAVTRLRWPATQREGSNR